MPLAKEAKIYKTFIISIVLAVVLCLSGIFIGISIMTRDLISDELITQARSHFESIVMARKWNAEYGGVYIEKKAGVESNPYIENPDIRTIDGKVYTLRNPAMMTREMSEYARSRGNVMFHITSDKLINPENKPDAFEERALALFKKGKKEVYQTESLNNRTYFRYMAPLFVEKACLQCHKDQGYSIGGIRGGISVTFDIGNIQDKTRVNTLLITLLAVVTTSSLLMVVWYFTRRLINKVTEAREHIERIAITDELTEIFNRRHVMKRFGEEFERAKRLDKDLGCIMFDIDHFKRVNDSYGHLVGDEVLKRIALITKEQVRVYDVLGRFGGEEFLIILSDTHFEDTKVFAERIRRKIYENLSLKPDDHEHIIVTISLGIASIHQSDRSVDDMLKRADKGLYQAKNSGRDRVGWIEVNP